MSVEASRITDVSNKWELATRISGQSKAPEQSLKALFTGIIQPLEEFIKIEASTKEKVWNKVSGERLKLLNDTLLLTFCEKILNTFSEKEVTEMLEEHKRTGAVKNDRYKGQLSAAIFLSKSLVTDAVAEKTKTFADNWVPEIVDALKQEGIQLPI